jgi:hypothetical protein
MKYSFYIKKQFEVELEFEGELAKGIEDKDIDEVFLHGVASNFITEWGKDLKAKRTANKGEKQRR